MSVGGGKAPAEPTKKRPNEEDDGPTAPASKKLKDANSIVNKLRLKLIDTLAEIEKSSQLVLAQSHMASGSGDRQTPRQNIVTIITGESF